MTTAAYNPLTSPVDYILLDGQVSPGLATVQGAGSPRKWDERVGYGWSGSFPVFLGRRLSHFKVILRLYDDADWEAWEVWKPLVDRPPFGKRPKARSIWHPWLVSLDIKSAVIEDCSQPEPIDNGAHQITIDFLEFRAPKISLAKPQASTPQVTDPVDKVIEGLAGEAARLAKDLQ